MHNLSEEKITKIKENIVFCLFNSFPKALFTSEIAKELARDEEFIKKMLLELEKNKLIIPIFLNNKGKKYKKRIKWTISSSVYEKYKSLSNNFNI
ncbi:MAG: hypothetical protein QW103_00375 [Candidatus Pacearchaeota archaeon]